MRFIRRVFALCSSPNCGLRGVRCWRARRAITSMISATARQLHARATVIVDEEAAANLAEKDHYCWIFANEPDWEEYR